MLTNKKIGELAKLVQEELPQIEATVLFYDGESKSHSRKIDDAIEALTTEHFIEYICDDLSVEKDLKLGSAQSGLLDEDNESYGLRRLHEAL